MAAVLGAIALVGPVRRVVLGARGGVDGYMCMIRGIRLIMDGFRFRKIFLGAWRLMGRASLWMVMGGIKGVGLIGPLRGRGCELKCSVVLRGSC